MKKAKLVGLIASGNLTKSPLTRFWRLSERLGPVKSPSYRVASRTANMLRAGHPVRDYSKFESCGLILVSVPEELVPRIVSEMLAAQVSWLGKTVVLCSAWLDSNELRELAAQGASVGSISPVPGFDSFYMLEGDRLAVLESKRLVETKGNRTVAIQRTLKPFYLAALTCTGSLLFALLAAASASLQHAGIRPAITAALLERQLDRTLRSFLKGGRGAYPAPLGLSRQLRVLLAEAPELAHYIEQSHRLAARLLEGL